MSQVMAFHVVLVAAAKSKSSSSGSITLLLLVGLFAIFYFFIMRPRAQKAKQARQQTKSVQVGDEISTIGGLVGTIVAEDGDRVTVSTANGTELIFLRQAIGRKIEPTTPEPVTDTSEFQGPPPGFEDGSSGDSKSEEPDAK